MKQRLINSQLDNWHTYEMYKRQLLTLAENVFEFINLPKYIDVAYLNSTLLRQGAIAFFVDEIMGLLALPYVSIGKRDVYGRPQAIEVIGQNGYHNILKSQDKFVIMYDNNGRYPLYLDILQYAERLRTRHKNRRHKYSTAKDTSFLENKNRKCKNNPKFNK